MTLANDLADTASVLLDLGLSSPRGLRLVTARAFNGRLEGADAAALTVGWIIPARESTSAMLLSLRGDVVEFEGEPRPLASLEISRADQSNTWIEMRAQRASGVVRYNYVAAILAALSGNTIEANTLWRSLRLHSGSTSRAAMDEFAELYFDSALAGLRAGRYGAARAMVHALECARPYIEQHGAASSATTTVDGGVLRTPDARSTSFLALVPTLAEELQRRSTRTRRTLSESQLATATLAELIDALDDIEPSPDRFTPAERVSPVARALRARGSAIVPELIDAFERDARWTRVVAHRSDPLERSVLSVRSVLAALITNLSGIHAGEFGWRSFSDSGEDRPSDVARALRERWNVVRSQTPFDRAITGLSDTSSNFERQIFSVAWLFRPAEGQPSTRVLVELRNASVIDRFADEGPVLTSAQREQLVQALRLRAPGLGPLRDRSSLTLAEEERRCSYAQMMFLASPQLAAPFVRETLERAYARNPTQAAPGCAAWLAGALVANGDRAAAAELARRMRAVEHRQFAIYSVRQWWEALADRAEALPVWEVLAESLANVSTWHVDTDRGGAESLASPDMLSIVSDPLLRAGPVRQALLRFLEDARLHGYVRFEPGSIEARYVDPRGERSLEFDRAADGPDFVAPNTIERLRLADGVAHYLATSTTLAAARDFDLRWNLARRERAISAIRAQLRAMQ